MPDNSSDSNPNLFPHCETYVGTQCRKYLGDQQIFIRPNVSQKIFEYKLTEAFTVINSSGDLSDLCEMYALPTLCYSTMPICKLTNPPTPELICRADCEMLENDICKMEYAIAKRHNIIGQVLSFENCSSLPATDCHSLGIPVAEHTDKSEKCYRGNGKDYRGQASKTESGKTCIKWNQSQVRTSNTTELLGDHNYCRNPGHLTNSKPWCFAPLKELCDIPECGDMRFLNTFVTLVGLLTLFFLMICCIYCTKKKKNKEQTFPNFKMSPGKSGIMKSVPDWEDSTTLREMSSLIPNFSIEESGPRRIKVMEFNFSNFKFQEELGEGAFGKVYRGEVAIANGQRILVAIKTLKENAVPKVVEEFKREVELMSKLRHPNIISLLGVCMTVQLCMVFEYMSQGDLHEYLISHSPSKDVPRNCVQTILESEDLMNISIQIAAGMEYLCNQHFVHRDLATRNCLVGDNLIVKISDFGLSRDVYSSDYYRVQKSALLPIRWMSPESILYGKFTIESDIWSYGVVLWEIYSYGLQPYYAYNNQDVVDLIRSHQVLSCPEDCPSRMYALMIECWNQVPSRRPQFAEIHSRLTHWRHSCSSIVRPNSVQLPQHIIHPHKEFHSHSQSYPVLMNK